MKTVDAELVLGELKKNAESHSRRVVGKTGHSWANSNTAEAWQRGYEWAVRDAEEILDSFYQAKPEPHWYSSERRRTGVRSRLVNLSTAQIVTFIKQANIALGNTVERIQLNEWADAHKSGVLVEDRRAFLQFDQFVQDAPADIAAKYFWCSHHRPVEELDKS